MEFTLSISLFRWVPPILIAGGLRDLNAGSGTGFVWTGVRSDSDSLTVPVP